MKGCFDKKVMDQVDHIITSDRRISDLVDIKNQNTLRKPPKKPIFGISYRMGAGGEFFLFLLLAHDSPLWEQRPLACWHPEYHTLFKQVRNKIPIHITHSAINFYIRDVTIPLIYIDCNLDYLIRLRKSKGKAIDIVNWKRADDILLDDDEELPLYKDDRKLYTNVINYFDPATGYYELCKTLQMTPDFYFYCWAWAGYLTWQLRYIKNKQDGVKVLNTINNLKLQLPKGYNGWTYKNF